MIKQGQTKMPLARIPQMARALDVDPVEFFRLAMREYMPELQRIADEMYAREQLSPAEAELLQQVRAATGQQPLQMTPKLRQALVRFLDEIRS
ncbi:hypothetical protein D3C71_1802260 [compost metagenome]